MTTYTVYLETSEEALSEGGYLAHVPSVPGCTGRGDTKEEALAKCREEMEQILALLRRHGLADASEDTQIELEVQETDQMTLPTDQEPLTGDELAGLRAQAAAMRQEFLEFLDGIPGEALGWRPDEDSWQLDWVLGHISGADMWYASRMEPGGLAELKWRLQTTRQVLLDQVAQAVASGQQSATVHHGEEWTPRKALRRMLEHEREHLDHLRSLLRAYEERGNDGE